MGEREGEGGCVSVRVWGVGVDEFNWPVGCRKGATYLLVFSIALPAGISVITLPAVIEKINRNK